MPEPIDKDLVIVGGGPAGLSAAIYAQRALLDAVTLERESVGGQMILTTDVDNYPGVPHANAFDLVEAMQSQATDLGAKIELDQVKALSHDEATGRFTVEADSATYSAASVILAAGARPRHAGFANEDAFAGRGVSYCATCDGMFYRNKLVFVIGGGNSAAEEALYLARLARKVVVLVRKDHLRAQASVIKQLDEAQNVEVRLLTSVVGVDGADLLTSISLRNNQTGEVTTETYDEGSFGVFVLVGRVPETSLIEGLSDLDQSGYALTDDHLATRTPGLFVAGDARAKTLRQIVTAAADGAIAATSAAAFLGQPVEG